MTESFGKVVTVVYEAYFTSTLTKNYKPPTFTTDSEYAQEVNNTYPEIRVDQGVSAFVGGATSWLMNREIAQLSITMDLIADRRDNQQYFIRGFSLIDAGTFALQRQLLVEQRIQGLYGTTTDIDLSRPTQD